MGGKLVKNKKGPGRGKVWVTGIQMLEGPEVTQYVDSV